MEPCQVAFIRQDDFSRFIEKYPEVHQAMMRQLSAQYHNTCEQMRTIALSGSSREKVARLLLHWSFEGRETPEGTRISVPLTHEQIAECVGSTRETITRTLSEFKSRHLVTFKGATMLIPNREALAPRRRLKLRFSALSCCPGIQTQPVGDSRHAMELPGKEEQSHRHKQK